MLAYKLKVRSLPKTVWACEAEVLGYNWENRHQKNMLELGLCFAEEITFSFGGQATTYRTAPLCSCTVGGMEKRAFSKEDTRVRTISVCCAFDALECEEVHTAKEALPDGSHLLVPAVLDHVEEADAQEVRSLLHLYIKHAAQKDENGYVLCCSLFFQLLSKIDFMTRKHLGHQLKDAENYYIKKIDYILNAHYAQNLSEGRVAKELGISAGYLSALYKKHTGISFSQSLFKIRMAKAEELLSDPLLPTAKIAARVGFSDEGYFRKRFKKHFGMSIREYRYIKNGLTLLHQKPTKNEQL